MSRLSILLAVVALLAAATNAQVYPGSLYPGAAAPLPYHPASSRSARPIPMICAHIQLGNIHPHCDEPCQTHAQCREHQGHERDICVPKAAVCVPDKVCVRLRPGLAPDCQRACTNTQECLDNGGGVCLNSMPFCQ